MCFVSKSELRFRFFAEKGREEESEVACSPGMPIRALFLALAFVSPLAGAQSPEPFVGQAGKDVIWVPTPPDLVEKMLDMAGVTAQDFVMDLGSGDGRNIIAAAKRGARAVGVEYERNLVQAAQRRAVEEGVADRASFIEGDMYEADISQATVLALFLLPDNLERLKPQFARLKPGTRIVNNGYQISGWEAKEVGVAGGDCAPWCTAYLYVIPARQD
jgi:SAM-dependent methyltransferase